MQSSCIVPERQQIPWHQVQGGVVGRWCELGQGRMSCSRTRGGDSVGISKIVIGVLVCQLSVSVLSVLHGSGAGSVLLIR